MIPYGGQPQKMQPGRMTSMAMPSQQQQQPGGATVAPGVGTFNNIVQPQPIYSQNQTQQAKNQSTAHFQQLANPRWAIKQFMAPGRSMDAGMMSAAVPYIGSQLAQMREAQGTIPLADLIANQQNLLSGQTSQDTESLGLSNLLSRMQNDNSNNALSWYRTMLGPLAGMLSGGA